jgi:hypothetical protein
MHAASFLAAHRRRTTGLPASVSRAASRAGKHRIGIAFMIASHFRFSGFFARRRLFELKVQIYGFGEIVGGRFGRGVRGPFFLGPRCLSGFTLPNHCLTIHRNLDIFNGHSLLALAAMFV